MLQAPKTLSSHIFSDEPDTTGSIGSSTYRIQICNFDPFIIAVKLTADNRFLDILEVKVNRDFLSHRQKMASLDTFDVEPYLEP